MNMVFSIVLVLGASFALAACSGSSSSSSSTTTPAVETQLKDGDTSITGVISLSGEKYYITDAAGKSQDLDSLAVELSEHVGKTVTVTGQFSGTTLFVGKVE